MLQVLRKKHNLNLNYLFISNPIGIFTMTSYALQKEKLSVDIANCLKEVDELINRGTYDSIII